MSFKFEIENKTIRQKKTKDQEDLFCSFIFCTPEWKHLEKYVIFWNKQGKSSIRYIGDGIKGQCPIPKSVLDDLYFHIQVYANDELFTHKIKIFSYEQKRPEHFYKHNNKKRMLNKFFESMENKIDNIVYEDNKLLIYSNNKLSKTIDIVDEQLLEKVLTNTAPDYIVDTALSPESNHPLANKVIYELLQTKMDLTSLSNVAFTGSYNDLVDVPEEFTPAQHNHNVEDINDFDDNVEESFDEFFDAIEQEFRF